MPETFATVIPAQAGIQGWGFPARNASHLRHAVSHRGSYATSPFAGTTDVGDLSAAEGYRDRYFAAQPSPSSVVVSGLYSQPTQPA